MEIWKLLSADVRLDVPVSDRMAVIYEGRDVVKGRRVVKEGGGRPGATPLR